MCLSYHINKTAVNCSQGFRQAANGKVVGPMEKYFSASKVTVTHTGHRFEDRAVTLLSCERKVWSLNLGVVKSFSVL